MRTLLSLVIILVMLALPVSPAVTGAKLTSFPDFTGANATVQITPSNIQTCIVQVIVIGSGTARIGNSDTSSTLGLPLVASTNGAGMNLPYPGSQCYQLSFLYAYVPSGVTLTVSYVK